jgi:hypothetical protein
VSKGGGREWVAGWADLDVISSVVVTAFSEQPVGNDFVNIKLVKDRVGVLRNTFRVVGRERKRKYLPC